MLCCVSCRVVSCRVVSCRVVSCRVVSCRVMSCRVVSCRVVSCRVVSCCVVLCCVVLCCVLLCCVVLCCVVLCCVVLCCVVLCCVVLSCCIVLCCVLLCCVVPCRALCTAHALTQIDSVGVDNFSMATKSKLQPRKGLDFHRQNLINLYTQIQNTLDKLTANVMQYLDQVFPLCVVSLVNCDNFRSHPCQAGTLAWVRAGARLAGA